MHKKPVGFVNLPSDPELSRTKFEHYGITSEFTAKTSSEVISAADSINEIAAGANGDT
jgi:hypothetical protein